MYDWETDTGFQTASMGSIGWGVDISFDHNFVIFEVFLTLYNFPYKPQEAFKSIQTAKTGSFS